MSKEDLVADLDEQPEQLCETCGSIMVIEDGELICPHCDGEIDYFGDVEDADAENDI